MGLTKAEQETVCTWDAEGRTWTVYSAHPPTMRRLARLAAAYGLTPTLRTAVGLEVRGLPTTAVRLSRPARPRNRPSEGSSSGESVQDGQG